MMWSDDNLPAEFKKVHIDWSCLPQGHYPYEGIYEDPDGVLYYRHEIKSRTTRSPTVTQLQGFIDNFMESGHDPSTTHIRWMNADSAGGYEAQLVATVYDPLDAEVTDIIREAAEEYDRKLAQRKREATDSRVDAALALIREHRPEILKDQ